MPAKSPAKSASPGKLHRGNKPSLTFAAAAIDNYQGNGCPKTDNLANCGGRASGFVSRMTAKGNTFKFMAPNSAVKCALFTDPKIPGVRSVDCFYFSGHSMANGPFLGWASGYDSDPVLKKSMAPADYCWSSHNLKWMLIDGCYALYDGQQADQPLNWHDGKFALNRWMQVFCPVPGNPGFGSLRFIGGNRANGFDVYWSTGSHFTEDCYDKNYSVGQAWLDAVDWTQYCGGGANTQGIAPAYISVGQKGTNCEWHAEHLDHPWGNPGNCDPASLYFRANYLWKGKPLFQSPPTRATHLHVLRGESPVTRGSRAAWLGAMGVRGATQKSAQFDFAQSGRKQVALHRDTGARSFADLDHLWGHHPAIGTPVEGKVPKGPGIKTRAVTPAAARRAADAFIRRQGWTETAEWTIDRIGGLMTSLSSETQEQHNCANRVVSYVRVIEGVPVAGAGSRLVVHVGENSEIIGASHDAPAISAKTKAPVALKSQPEAARGIDDAVIQLSRQCGPQMAIQSFKPKSTVLSYHGTMAADGSRELVPAYLFEGTATRTDGSKFTVSVPVAASDDHPITDGTFGGKRR